MSRKIDDILDAIDAGLQSSDERSYGDDFRTDLCARCQRHAPDDGDLCGGCRAFLLEDSNDDPKPKPVYWRGLVVNSGTAERVARIARGLGLPEDMVVPHAAWTGRSAHAVYLDDPIRTPEDDELQPFVDPEHFGAFPDVDADPPATTYTYMPRQHGRSALLDQICDHLAHLQRPPDQSTRIVIGDGIVEAYAAAANTGRGEALRQIRLSAAAFGATVEVCDPLPD